MIYLKLGAAPAGPEARRAARLQRDDQPNFESQAMTRKIELTSVAMSAIAALLMASAMPSYAVDEDAATALAKKSNCTKCHAVDKKKDGPPYKEVAAKYKGKSDAEKKLYTHLTTNPKVEVDGKKEEHESLKSKNDADIKNVIEFILSR